MDGSVERVREENRRCSEEGELNVELSEQLCAQQEPVREVHPAVIECQCSHGGTLVPSVIMFGMGAFGK